MPQRIDPEVQARAVRLVKTTSVNNRHRLLPPLRLLNRSEWDGRLCVAGLPLLM